MSVAIVTMRGKIIDWKIENSRGPRSCAPICSSWLLCILEFVRSLLFYVKGNFAKGRIIGHDVSSACRTSPKPSCVEFCGNRPDIQSGGSLRSTERQSPPAPGLPSVKQLTHCLNVTRPISRLLPSESGQS